MRRVNAVSWATDTDDGVLLRVHVQPRAKKTGVVGVHGDALKVRIQAPPVDGAANKALISFLADQLGVSKAALTLQSGHTGRRKTVLIWGLSVDEVKSSLLPK